MSISNGNGLNGFNGYEDLLGDLAKQEAAAQNRRLEPPDPIEFLKWITETLRDHRAKYEKLASTHKKLNKKADLATVGLKRLESLVTIKNRARLDFLKETHRTLAAANSGIGYTLDRCKKILDETTISYQLIGETLKSPLADRHKKIAMRKEIGLRLKDIDAEYKRCFQAVALQKKQMRQLSEGIQTLMHKASIKLPPKMRETINREDQVAKIAQMHKKSLSAGRDRINTTPYDPTQDKSMSGYLGYYGEGAVAEAVDAASEAAAAAETKPKAPTPETPKGIDPKYAIAAVAAGATLGVILLFSGGEAK